MSMAVPTAMASAHSALAAHPSMPDAALDELLRQARHKARQNLYGSLVWHLLMTPLALVGWVTPWLAAITMLVSSLAVAYNSWRLCRRDWSGELSPSGALEAAQ
jgi:cation transport ATPase